MWLFVFNSGIVFNKCIGIPAIRAREKSNPEIPVPTKFHELPLIIKPEKEKVDGL